MAPTADYYHYALDTTLGPNPPVIDPKTPLLLAGLGVSETDLLLLFALLKNEMPFDAAGHAALSRHTLSLLYRHVLLARTLGYSVPDLVAALALVFPTPAAEPVVTLDGIDALLDFHRWQTGAAFGIPQLQLVLTGVAGAAPFAQSPATVAALVLDIQKSGLQPRLDVLRTKLATAFNVGSGLLEEMLAWVAHDITAADVQAALDAPFTGAVPDNPATLLPLLELLHRLERVALVFSVLKLKDAGIGYLTANAGVLGIADLKALTLHDLQAVTAYAAQVVTARQATQAADAETTVQQLLSGYAAAGSFDAAARVKLANLRQVDPSLIDSIVAAVALPPVAIDALDRLDEVFALCRTLSVNAYSLEKLGLDGTFAQLTDAAAVAVGAVGAQYKDDAARDKALEPYRDRINTLKRDALCGYLIDGVPALNFLNHEEIYSYFLLDVDMSGCARTSWVVAALSSLQLYVQRCLTALEQSDPAVTAVPQVRVVVPDVAAKQWEWRKHFRVWQANRKVFLYPESYMDPDLRDDKTPIFSDLEADLLQQPLTADTGEEAFHRYLTRLAEVAHLRICGSYYDDSEVKYYFFARTQADPPVFYYRTWDTSTWTPWVKIDLTIDAPWVSAVKHHGRLFLFWTSIKFAEHTSFSNGASHDDPTTTKVGASYSVLRPDGRWQPPQKLDWLYPNDAKNAIWYWQAGNLVEMPRDKVATTAYPVSDGENITLRYLNRYAGYPDETVWDSRLDLFHNQLVPAPPRRRASPRGRRWCCTGRSARRWRISACSGRTTRSSPGSTCAATPTTPIRAPAAPPPT
ncbi:neuraminidase-like domain-containing protein [Catenulispora yoronensis]